MSFGPKRTDYGLERADLGDLGPERADLGPERSLGRTSLGSLPKNSMGHRLRCDVS